MMLISSDHLTRFQSAKALFARMEEESARQQRRTAAAASKQQQAADQLLQQSPPHTNIFLIKSKFESTTTSQVGPTAITPVGNSRRSLAFGGSIGSSQGQKLNLNNPPRKRLTMGPIATDHTTTTTNDRTTTLNLDEKHVYFPRFYL